MDEAIFRKSLEHACLQVQAEYRLHQSDEGMNMALAKLKGILVGCIASARGIDGEADTGALMEIAREVIERHQRELVREG